MSSGIKTLAVSLAAFAVVAGAGAFSVSGAAAAGCVYDAQIQAQQEAIVQLQQDKAQAIAGLPPALAARISLTYDAQITARQQAVAELQAACAS